MTRRYKMPRTQYNFNDQFKTAGDEVKMIFESRHDAVRARSAAHVYAHAHSIAFKTKLRETDSGMFELTITRVS